MKELIKRNEGITLIALIITIIILIILTAVTINNVIGTDLIGFATKAVENYTDAARDEADKVDKLAGTLDNQGVGEDSAVRAGQIVTETVKDNYTDANGRHATIPEGFKVSTKASEQYVKDGLVIQDADGNEFVWVPCYYEDTEHAKPAGTAADVQEYKSHNYEENGNDWKTFWYTEFKDWEDEAAEKYGNDSVKKYGGFYIARYEAGWEDTETTKLSANQEYITNYDAEKTKKNETAISTDKKPISKANVFAWNFISQKNALQVANNMYENSETEGHANSYLVDGTAWDTITNWIATDGEKMVTESTSYGNYLDNGSNYTGWYAEHIYSYKISAEEGTLGWLYANKFKNGPITLHWKDVTENDWNTMENDIANANKQTNATDYNLDTRIEIPTGSFDKFKLKNIYDLAGNMWEWTTEVGKHDTSTGSSFAVMRGGSFDANSTDFPLCCRHGDVSSATFLYYMRESASVLCFI